MELLYKLYCLFHDLETRRKENNITDYGEIKQLEIHDAEIDLCSVLLFHRTSRVN